MTRLFAAIRTLAYMAGFVYVWGLLAVQVERLGDDVLPTLPPLRLLAWVFMGCGGLLALACAAAFVMEGQGTPAPFDAPRALVPRGPYRWVRNPMYLGALLLLLGFGLWRGSLAILLFTIPAAVSAHLLVVFYEEPTLRRRFGSQYAAYVARVHRWIPKPPTSTRAPAA
jgi:protein-S-isoprenylcysteine O-methyltransferase Ste14